MMRHDSIGEQVARMVEGIEAHYALANNTPLAEMIAARSFETKTRLRNLANRPVNEVIRLRIAVKGFDTSDAEHIERLFPRFRVTQSAESDVILMDPYQKNLENLLSADALRLFWAHDHHHTYGHYVMYLLRANIVVPAHFHRRDHLFAFNRHIADTIPATTNQWTSSQILEFSSRIGNSPRSDELYGGFGAYDVGLERSFFVGAVMEQLPEHALSVRRVQDEDDPYFTLSEEDRFVDWCRHKVSLAAPINQDIPIRIFDALASGQIPIIPDTITNLNWLITSEDQTRLGIERYEAGNPLSAVEAWRRAVDNFDRMGSQGAQERISYFQNRHSIPLRIERMINDVFYSLTRRASSRR